MHQCNLHIIEYGQDKGVTAARGKNISQFHLKCARTSNPQFNEENIGGVNNEADEWFQVDDQGMVIQHVDSAPANVEVQAWHQLPTTSFPLSVQQKQPNTNGSNWPVVQYAAK
ncbi:hypothetical protein CONPUDRAFT_71622 [Coniophora puteana RWD-64-598 SS2]|uniref:Uncharacterized protein n=1 Tax=Coniophora puteana (strain RWD-64-598) TaxID=741705 RepID=A0A5M3MWJ8_CONPW|nr:uncharacterized protein CONPUDRAFT_71622 [Coniophora puteana RWD-64-598 SS2]EIW82971.1 hypothetical protein CONPUDRAFT_71622 [Coniophora puteana RWD-64-598 SS2]